MKTHLLLFLIGLTFQVSHAQFGAQQVISIEAANVRSIYAIDIDGDGDKDVLSASEGDDKVAWYENTDGLGTFGIQQVITMNLHSAIDVFASDLDGDIDIDIVVASKGDNSDDGKVVWFENLDGLGDFSAQRIITNLTQGPLSVFAIDLDSDGDKDVLSASFLDNKIAWYENTDGLGTFGVQQIISNTALSARDVFATDLDGDGDMDVLGAVPGSAEVIWYENLDGLGSFSSAQSISNETLGILSIFAIDIDGDDDMDVLSASPSDNKVAWYKNLDGLGSFGEQQVLTSGIENELTVYADDLDNDGDMDVLSASQHVFGDYIVWYENLDGLGTFGPHQIITTEAETEGPRDVITADLDNDGDMDVLSASIIDYKVAWYENLTLIGISDFSNESITIVPNPVTDILRINNTSTTQIESINIYDVLGRLVFQEDEHFNSIDVSYLKSGLLFVTIETEQGIVTKKVVKK